MALITFSDEPSVRPVVGERFLWQIQEEWWAKWLRPGKPPVVIIIREKSVTDFASIPQLFWNIAPPTDGRYLKAALGHDALYGSHQLKREEADQFLFEAAIVCGCERWLANVLYYGARIGGEQHYKDGYERQAHRNFIARQLLWQEKR